MLARRFLCIPLLAAALSTSLAARQPDPAPVAPVSPAPPIDPVPAAIDRCVEFLLSAQEGGQGDSRAEWPYEGVYRVGGRIPIGYRIGGTSIVAAALLCTPGYDADEPRQAAVARALKYVRTALHEPLMDPDYEGGYDVRGWGYTYALHFLLALKSAGELKAVPDELRASTEAEIRWCIDAIQQTEIAEAGGWNYARGKGKAAVSPPSPFMTGPTLMALFDAAAQGFAVDPAVIDRGLKALERGRAPSGSVAYAGKAREPRPEPIPGSVGRMLATETALYLAGRSDVSRIRGALDAFLVHWEWLDQRRAKKGTHEGPYGVAPYYFYYAHAQAARAITFLPTNDRAEYRRRLLERLFEVRLEDGLWNDRVFPRTANYGTSQALLVLLMPTLPKPSRWSPPGQAPAAPDAPNADTPE
jgi:hypothetical protein